MNQADFAGWYEREAPGVYRALALAVGDRRLAEECAAEAFARAWAHWSSVADMASPVGWVYRVALNQAHSAFRRRRRHERFLARQRPATEGSADADGYGVASS